VKGRTSLSLYIGDDRRGSDMLEIREFGKRFILLIRWRDLWEMIDLKVKNFNFDDEVNGIILMRLC
jgi:hypothetical protein